MARGFRNSRGAYGADLEMIEQINAFQNTNELEDNLVKIRKLLNEFYTNELNDFTNAVQNQINRISRNPVNNGNFIPRGSSYNSIPLNSSDAQAIRNMGQRASEEYAEGVAEGLKGGNGKGVNWASIGKEIGTTLANSLIKTVSEITKSWVNNTYGNMDITGSFARGNQLFSTMRSDLGNLTLFNDKTLKDFGKTIESSYKSLKEQGVMVSPTTIYSMYSRLGDLVSISGSSNSRLTSLLNTVTRMEQGAGQLDVTSDYVERLIGSLGEELGGQVAVIQGQQMAFVASQNDKFTNELQQYSLNNTRLLDSLLVSAKQMGLSNEETVQYIKSNWEDIAQGIGYLAQNSSSVSAQEIVKLTNSVVNASNTEWAQIFADNGGLGALLTQTNAGKYLNYSTPGGLKENIPQLMLAISEALQSNLLTEEYAAQMSKTLGIDIDWANLSMIRNGTITSQGYRRAVNETITPEQLSKMDKAITNQTSLADRMANYDLELSGLMLSTETYQNEMLGSVITIANTLLDFVGHDTIKHISTGFMSGIGNMLGVSASGGSGGGFLSLLSKIPAWGWVLAGITALGGVVLSGVSKSREETTKQLSATAETLNEFTGPVLKLNDITENTLSINDILEGEYGNEPVDTNVTLTGFDDSGNPIYTSNINAQGEDVTSENLALQNQSFNKQAMSNYLRNKPRAGRTNSLSINRRPLTGAYAGPSNSDAYLLATNSEGKQITVGLNKYTPTSWMDDNEIYKALTDESKELIQKGTITYDDIRRSVFANYYDDNSINALRLTKLLSIPAFHALYNFYNEAGFFENENVGILKGNNILGFVNHFDDRLEKFKEKKIYYPKSYNSMLDIANSNDVSEEAKAALEQLYNSTDEITADTDKAIEYWNMVWNPPSMSKGRDFEYVYHLPDYSDYLINGYKDLSWSKGLDNVPYDAYPALLHRGEMVIPASRANYIRMLFGQKPVTPSTYAENIDTKENKFVQSIPQYAAGVDAVRFAVSNLGAPYEGNGTPGSRSRSTAKGDSYNAFDCSSLVSRSYGALDEPGSVSPTIIPLTNTEGMYNNLSKWGFIKLFDAGSSKTYGDEDDLKRIGIITGDILLYGNGKKGRPLGINHVAIAENGTSQIHANVKVRRDRLHPYSKPHLAAVFRYAGGDTSVVGGLPTTDVPLSTEISSTTDVPLPTEISYGYNTPIGTVGMTPRVIPDAIQRLMGVKNPVVQSMLRRLGYDTSVAENTTNPTTSSSTINYSLASLRNSLWNTASDIDKLMFFNRTLREVGGQSDPAAQAWMETVMNRAASRSKTLRQVITGAYYGKNNDGGLTNALSDANKLRLDAAVALVLAGSNLTKYATGNASGNVGFGYGNGKDDPYTLMVDGERFGIEKGDKNWWVKLGIAALANGGIINATPGGIPAILGEGKHDEAVIPLNDNKDYLGIEEIGVNIIDALDIISNKLCERLDTLISLKQREMSENASAKSLPTKQRNARTEALISFQGIY